LPEAFEEDCERAVLVLSARQAPPFCSALVIDRTTRRNAGAMAVMRKGEGFELVPARPPGYDRPWAPRSAAAAVATEPGNAPRDATPAAGDLEAGD
jgi:competence protein ComEC